MAIGLALLVHAAGSLALGAQIDGPMEGIAHHDRALLVQAAATGKSDGIVLIATRLGATDSVLRAVVALGGIVRVRFDDVGYARVRVPLAQFAHIRALPGVIEARIDAGNVTYAADQHTGPGASHTFQTALAEAYRVHTAAIRVLDRVPVRDPSSVPAEALGAYNPYVPIADVGVQRLRAIHPTFDGRGVTIAVLEGGSLDFAHPALQDALRLGGQSVPKIRGVIDPHAYEPDEPDERGRASLLTADTVPDRSWVRRTGMVDAHQGTFTLEGHLYHAPRPGRYNVGIYHAGGGGEPARMYGVVWDGVRKHVWVDTNRDFDFRGETALTDINRAFSFGWLRRDSTATQPERSVSFAVAFDSAGTGLRVYEGRSTHQTMVASSAAGQHLLNGAATGVAPGAQIVIAETARRLAGDAGETLSDEIEALIRAERDPRVDLVTWSLIGESYPSAGESILSIVATRAIHVYGKPIFAAADNYGPLMATTSEPAATDAVMSVGASGSRASYAAHYGWDVPDTDEVMPYSSRGPSRSGGLKPDILAPALLLSAAPCSAEPDTGEPTRYTMPRCYQLGGGTSNATPVAAGAGAVLLSAARQAHLSVDATHLMWAMRMGAHILPGYGAHEQGNGLVDVVRAWELLEQAINLPHIESQAAVRTMLAPYLRHPGTGVGLYEREGWSAGDTGTQLITVTRRAGRAAATLYHLSWVGNDGTFAAPAGVALPRGIPVTIPVHIAPRTTGAHSAILRLVDSVSGLPVHAVLATVVAAEQFTPATGYIVHVTRREPWPRTASVFVNVPPGVAMMRVALNVARGRYSLRTGDPKSGEALEEQAWLKGYRYPFSRWTFTGGGHQASELIPNPRAGVWEFALEPFDIPDMPSIGADSEPYNVPGDVELTATIVRATGIATAATDTGVGASIGAAIRTSVHWTNTLGPIGHAVVRAELGIRHVQRVPVDTVAGPVALDVDVDSGTTALRVEAMSADTTADVDAYVYDCTGDRCYLWDDASGIGATKALVVRHPSPGHWKILLDPARVPNRTTSVLCAITQTNPTYGTVTVVADSLARQSGAQWTARLRAEPTVRALGDGEWIVGAEVVDDAAESAEQARPLAFFTGLPYRPAAAGWIAIPFTARPGGLVSERRR